MALCLMLINVISFVPVVLGPAVKPCGLPLFFLAMLLTLFTALGAICLLVDFAVGKLIPSLKRLTGAILLALAIMPWLGELIYCVISTVAP